jgi:superfamily I DNA and RNA helicase
LIIDDLFSFDTSYLESSHIAIIRSILFPELKIENIEKDKIKPDKIRVLDIDQEKFAKRIPYGHYMISGVPGSGKTVILLSRAIFLLKENPDWKIKIVTYNISLSRKINQRLESLYDDLNSMGLNYENISVSTFHKLALDTSNIVVPNNPNNDFWDRVLPLKALEKACPKYDAILIDEYQDFYDDSHIPHM